MNGMTVEQEERGIFKLWARNRIEQRRHSLSDATEARQKRATLIRRVAEYAENGKIAIVNSGMDCDCSRWENRVSVVRAKVKLVDEWVNDFRANAEGPQSFYLERPSVAKQLQHSSRDLVLEGFENGHSYSISSIGSNR
jgi:hypothetical protein